MHREHSKPRGVKYRVGKPQDEPPHKQQGERLALAGVASCQQGGGQGGGGVQRRLGANATQQGTLRMRAGRAFCCVAARRRTECIRKRIGGDQSACVRALQKS